MTVSDEESAGMAASAQALRALIGIEGVKSGAWLAGLSGGALLILAAAVVWLGAVDAVLGIDWLAWTVLPALGAAFGGPLLGRQVLSRQRLRPWRLLLAVVMSWNSAVWAYALVATLGDPQGSAAAALAVVALAFAVVPTLLDLRGLLLQLALQLSASSLAVYRAGDGGPDALLAFGLWAVIALLSITAAIIARRVDLMKGDLHYLRFETSELQRRIDEDQLRLQAADDRRLALEGELAEILDLAEDASRAKTEFLAMMSHEIRTPLNGILPILEMMRDTPLNSEQLRFVRTAQSSSRHLLRIINDILDFAKVESGKLQLETIEIDVRDLVNSVTELMSGSARNHNLKLSVKVNDNVPEVVRGDPIRLRQVLINLVSNAIKFTEEGGIRVEVSRGQTSQKEVELLFAVADTGVGMSAETADRLFQSFTQADASTTRKHGGTGLGLVICKRLVELMGGKIGVRSTLGQGSIFWFLVPLRKSVMEVPSARRDLNGVRVLTMIGDEEAAARVSAMFRSWGIVEDATSEPNEALTKLQSTALLGGSWIYDLALIDEAGIEARLPSLLADIRSLDALRRMNVLVVVRSDTVAHKMKRDYGVLVLSEALRPEPLRRMLFRLFDVESRHFGSVDPRTEEVYDDLNVTGTELDISVEAAAPRGEFAGRVMLVEDNPVNLGVVKKALSKLGLSCETATHGKEALALFEQQRFDIIFMDCQMPEMDGYEATRRIRSLEEQQSRLPTPVVAMTANAMAGDRERCIDVGMDDYLTKPVSLDKLRECVANWLNAADTLPQTSHLEAPLVNDRLGDDKPVLDEKVLRELKEIMDDDYLGLLRTYLNNAPQLVSEARSAIARADVGALVNPVHSLKSSSANVGAMRVSELARETERQARLGDLSAAMRTFVAVESAFQEAELALHQLVSGYSPA